MENPEQVYYTSHEKAALVTYLLVEGAALSTSEIAERVGVSRQAALYMMDSVSRVVPIYRDDGSRWRRFSSTT